MHWHYKKDTIRIRFHLQHAFTVEAVMKWYANELGYAEDAEYWGIVGLLHDIDFEQYPEEHCLKAPELLREGGVGEDIIHSVVSPMDMVSRSDVVLLLDCSTGT